MNPEAPGAFAADRHAFTVTQLANGDVLVVGGRTNAVTATQDAYLWIGD